jgi:membrane protein implicated in regulation of membrane protease activity
MITYLADIFTNNITWIVIWASVFVIALVVEFSTDQLISIWFCGSSIVALILAIFNVYWWIQIIVFAVLSAILLVLSKFVFFKNRKKEETIPTNVDSLIGKEMTITKVVTKEKFGEGQIRDVVWSVSLSEDESDPIQVGEKAIIKEIVGNHIVVTKKN